MMNSRLAFFFIIITGLPGFSQQNKPSPFSYNSLLTSDYVNILSGGVKTGQGVLGDISIQLGFDTKKAGLWNGGTFSVYGLGDFGMDPSENNVGCTQTFDNIETPDKHQLFEYWYKHQLKRGYVVVGQSNVNAEFFHSNYGSKFINSNFNTQPDIAVNAHVSIFSKAALGVKFRYDLSSKSCVLGCVYNGYEGTPADNPYNLHYRFSKRDGMLYMAEVKYLFKHDSTETGNIKLGAWLHTGEFFSPADSVLNTNRGGIYCMGEQLLLPIGGYNQGLGVFFMSGFVPSQNVHISWHVSLGINYSGLFLKRTSDILALAIINQRMTDRFVNYSPDKRVRNEILIEMYYTLPVNNFITIQPDFQYFINPGASREISHSFIGIFRVMFLLGS